MASGVTRVIGRCDEAQESLHLDLSDCQLVQMPDAVFHLMRNTPLIRVNLSSNLIARIPPKMGLKFNTLTELNLSSNRLGKLPDELREMKVLEKLDISCNSFLIFPTVVYELPLKVLDAKKNQMEDFDIERFHAHENLEHLDLRDNPISERVRGQLEGKASSKTVLISPVKIEEWELD